MELYATLLRDNLGKEAPSNKHESKNEQMALISST